MKDVYKRQGTININSDGSVGVGLLHNIQAVQVGGTINIGTTAPTGTLANSGSDATKVEGAIGVYSEVETRPVRGREYARGSHGEQLFEADGVTPKEMCIRDRDHCPVVLFLEFNK